MPALQNYNRPFGFSKAPIKNRNSRDGVRTPSPVLTGAVKWDDSSLDDDFQAQSATIQQANTVKFAHVCRHYGIEVDAYNVKIRCPFKFHNDGDPSFQYYPETNSFFCWGCKNSGGPVNFVALLENISKTDAADKLLDNFESDEVDASLCVRSKEKEELFLKFSTMVRNFLKENQTPEALAFIDTITQSFDAATRGRKRRERDRVVDVEGIKHAIDEQEKRIGKYECP